MKIMKMRPRIYFCHGHTPVYQWGSSYTELGQRDSKITYRMHIETGKAKTLRTFTRFYFLLGLTPNNNKGENTIHHQNAKYERDKKWNYY
jgi:hypothetical protein